MLNSNDDENPLSNYLNFNIDNPEGSDEGSEEEEQEDLEEDEPEIKEEAEELDEEEPVKKSIKKEIKFDKKLAETLVEKEKYILSLVSKGLSREAAENKGNLRYKSSLSKSSIFNHPTMIEAAADLEAQGITLVDENFARGLFSRMEVYEESPIEAFNRMAKLAKLRQKSTDPNLSKLSAADKRVLKMLQAAYPKAGWTAKKYIESEKEG